MSPRERLLIISLSEKISKNPAYAKQIGLEIRQDTTFSVTKDAEKINVKNIHN